MKNNDKTITFSLEQNKDNRGVNCAVSIFFDVDCEEGHISSVVVNPVMRQIKVRHMRKRTGVKCIELAVLCSFE